jgi:septal ring factor EnvC (AmiA/AmiB activator)
MGESGSRGSGLCPPVSPAHHEVTRTSIATICHGGCDACHASTWLPGLDNAAELLGCASATKPCRQFAAMTSIHSASRTRFQRLAACVLVIVLAATLPAGAQDGRIEDAKADRENARAAAAERAGDLDPLLAEDLELQAALEALEAHVATQEAKLETIQQTLGVSRSEAEVAANRVIDLQIDIGAIRGALQQRALEAYVSTDTQRVDSLFTSDDITVAAHKRALLDTINANEADLIDVLRSAEAQLEDLADEADAAVNRVTQEEAAEAEQLQELEHALAEEERVKAALETRIADVRFEIDALEGEEDRLTSLITGLIAEGEARERAAEEARRRAKAQRLLALEAEKNNVEAEDIPTPEPLPPPESAGNLQWPAGGIVTSGFGPRWGRMHNGLDIAAASGSAIAAAQGGTVIQASAYGGYGNMIVIDHGGGFTTVYAHLSSYSVSTGQSVSAGSVIGAMGCSGSCTGPHLHFETRVNGVPQNPMLYL